MQLRSRIAAGLLALSSIGALGIISHEGMKRVAYRDPVGIVTVCAGHTATAKLGQVKTEAECAELLKQDVKYAEQAVKRLVKVPLTQEQFDALVSFTFNVGETSLAKSTLLKKINNFDCWGAGKEFIKWTYAGGQQLPGLVIRRAAERKHWETGCATGNYKVKANPQAANSPYVQVRAQARRPEYHVNPMVVGTPQPYTLWR